MHDQRHSTFEGPDGLKQLYDYADSVRPLAKWWHDAGPFAISGSEHEARAGWLWIVNWGAESAGVVSTILDVDRFQKCEGVCKCLERTSTVHSDWPAALFQPYVDREDKMFRAS